MLRAITLVLAVAAAAILSALFSFNHFKKIEPDIPGVCTPVTGIAGPEDLQVDRLRGRAFISSLDRRADEPRRGAIHVIDVLDPLAAAAWRDRTGGTPADFEPLGLSYYEDDDFRRLFVVNTATNAVELFDVPDNGELQHLRSFAEARLTSPNDVAAVGPTSFYVTNDLAAGRTSWLGRLQFLGRVGAGAIYAFDGVSWRLAADGLRFANGIALSEDRETLYVAETSGMALKTYARDPRTGFLTLRRTTPLPGAADNLNVSADGSVLIAANPKPLTLPAHQRMQDVRSPSLILRYREDPSDPFDGETRLGEKGAGGVSSATGFSALTQLFQSTGEELSAATAADAFRRKLLIGALVEDKFLICDLRAASAYRAP